MPVIASIYYGKCAIPFLLGHPVWADTDSLYDRASQILIITEHIDK